MNILKLIRKHEAKLNAAQPKPVFAEPQVTLLTEPMETTRVNIPPLTQIPDFIDPTPPEWMQSYNDQNENIFVPQTEWQEKVIPYNLQLAWDDPMALYNHIISAANDHLIDQPILDASIRLLEIDPDQERAYSTRAIVLLNTYEYAEAESLLKQYINLHGESATILLNLAKAYHHQGKKSQFQTSLQRSLALDPNHDNAVNWYLSLEREERGEYAYMEALTMLAADENAWYPQFRLATEFVLKHDLEQAVPMLRSVIRKGKDHPNLLLWVSGMLGENGLSKEAIRLVLPYYNPMQHEVMVGYNLLQACVETQNKQMGMAVLQNLRDTNLPWLDQGTLSRFAEQFDRMI